ncbi:hypothetical protein EJB05_01809, partial [Eragrostis curvula]
VGRRLSRMIYGGPAGLSQPRKRLVGRHSQARNAMTSASRRSTNLANVGSRLSRMIYGGPAGLSQPRKHLVGRHSQARNAMTSASRRSTNLANVRITDIASSVAFVTSPIAMRTLW